jgi:hypothetical protein
VKPFDLVHLERAELYPEKDPDGPPVPSVELAVDGMCISHDRTGLVRLTVRTAPSESSVFGHGFEVDLRPAEAVELAHRLLEHAGPTVDGSGTVMGPAGHCGRLH